MIGSQWVPWWVGSLMSWFPIGLVPHWVGPRWVNNGTPDMFHKKRIQAGFPGLGSPAWPPLIIISHRSTGSGQAPELATLAVEVVT